MAIGTRMQQRRALAAEWDVSDYVLAAGELGVTTDSGIIKIGDGLNTWSNLDPAFGSEYLPLLGTAADSELLGGIGSDGYAKVGDVPTTTEMNDAITNAIPGIRQMNFSRAVTANFELELTDANATIFATNVNWGPELVGTIPTNATVAIPIGSTIGVFCPNKGAVKMTPAGGVTLRGNGVVYGGSGGAYFTKTATDEWLVSNRIHSAPPMVKRFVTAGYSLVSGTWTVLPLAGSNSGVNIKSQMIDSLGTGVQYDSAVSTDRVFCRREGWYDILFEFHLVSAAAGRAAIEPRVNGIAQHTGRINSVGVSGTGVSATASLPLSVDDYVQMAGFQDTGSSRVLSQDPASPSFIQWTWRAPL